MMVVCLIFVLIGTLEVARSQEDYVVRQGDDVIFECQSPCDYCNYYHYYYYETALYINKQFGWDRSRLWSRDSGFDYPYEFGGRLTVERNGYNFTVNMTDLRFGDAGAYVCRIGGSDVKTYNLVVIGREVTFSIDDSSDSYITDNGTCLATCSFDMSSHPWGNDYPHLEVTGASVARDLVKNNFTTIKTFELSLQRSDSFICKVVLFNQSAALESNPISFILNATNGEEDTYVATRGGNVLLSCTTLYPFNKGWKWFYEDLYQGDKVTFPIVECVLNTAMECRNQSKSSLLKDVSTKSYSLLSFVGIALESSGTYTCIDDMFTLQKSINLIVVDGAPSKVEVNGILVENKGTLDIVKDESVIIACSILSSDGKKETNYHPKLVVENAEFINYTRNGSYLVYYYKAFINESRSYTCFIEIKKGMQVVNEIQNYTINFKVFYCPQQLVILSDAKNGSIERGSVLSCRTSAVPPVDLIWTSGDKTVKSDNGPNYADLRVYSKILYSCMTNIKYYKILGVCETLSISMEPARVESRRYEEIKKPVRLGRSLTVDCITYYNKNNNWKWIKDWNPNFTSLHKPMVDCRIQENLKCANISTNKRILDHSNRSFTSLLFPVSDIEDSGTYSCMDSMRTVVKTYRVDVFACPSRLFMSRENQPDGSTELICTVNANPPVSLVWTRGGDNTALSTGLNTVKVKVNTNGAYKCFVPSTTHPFLGNCGELSLTDIVDVF